MKIYIGDKEINLNHSVLIGRSVGVGNYDGKPKFELRAHKEIGYFYLQWEFDLILDSWRLLHTSELNENDARKKYRDISAGHDRIFADKVFLTENEAFEEIEEYMEEKWESLN